MYIEDEERRVRESDGKQVDTNMKNNIEGIIIKWTHQVTLLLLALARWMRCCPSSQRMS